MVDVLLFNGMVTFFSPHYMQTRADKFFEDKPYSSEGEWHLEGGTYNPCNDPERFIR